MLYNGFAQRLAKRVERRLEEMVVHQNFEYGAEFEIALCRVLRTVLPARCGVCRGYIVEQGGQSAGDDIIVYDAHRFPTLRALDQQLELHEEVPAEAVLAYLEGKRTLYADPENKQKGQSVQKALAQVAAVKRLNRAAVPLTRLAPHVNVACPPFQVAVPEGRPNQRNPWFAMIVAQQLDAGADNPRDGLIKSVSLSQEAPRPDVIAAGEVFMFPALFKAGAQTPEAAPFLCSTTELIAVKSPILPMAMALLHLLWAIDSIELDPLPFGAMLQEIDPARNIEWRRGTPPLKG